MPSSRRLTISVPAELSERLDGAKGAIVVSNVCAVALEKAVLEHEQRQGQPQTLEHAIARLRAQRLESSSGRSEQAYAAGWTWLMKEATFDEIEQLFIFNRHTELPDFLVFEWMRDVFCERSQDDARSIDGTECVYRTVLERFCVCMRYDAVLEGASVPEEEWCVAFEAFLTGIGDGWAAIRTEVLRDV